MIQIPLEAGHHRTNNGPTLNAGWVAWWFFRGSGQVLLSNPIALCFSWGPDPGSGTLALFWAPWYSLFM